jgi:branched-chain amino acid transport system ATP-binding protein
VTATLAAGPTLRLDGLTVRRGTREVVRDVSLEVPPGEITALLGPNGAGKSTLVLALAGLLRPAKGEIVLGHDQLSRRPEQVRADGVAVVPEGRRVLRDLSVEDNLRIATYSLTRRDARAGVARALELFPELKPRRHTDARSLSGGEQQMLALARALVSYPRVLVVDELSLGLAPVIVKRLARTIGEIADSGVGVLLIEQFAHLALGLARTVYILEGGRIRYRGTARELQQRPELLHSAYLLGDRARRCWIAKETVANGLSDASAGRAPPRRKPA